MAVRQAPREPTPDLLTAGEVARRLRVSVRTLYRLTLRGQVPQPIRFSRKLVRWRARDIARYVRGLERLSG
jgi:excisionase family DNA binding protein